MFDMNCAVLCRLAFASSNLDSCPRYVLYLSFLSTASIFVAILYFSLRPNIRKRSTLLGCSDYCFLFQNIDLLLAVWVYGSIYCVWVNGLFYK
jgi:hypothetical protein